MSSHAKPEPFEVHYDGLPTTGASSRHSARCDSTNRGALSCRRKSDGGAAAAVRALEAIEQLPDDDPPGTEEQFMRNFDEDHPHRPQFEGYY